MAMKKIVISLPEPVLEQLDWLAASRGESRSHLIATVLNRVARAKRDRDVTAQIDALLADEMIAEQESDSGRGSPDVPMAQREVVIHQGDLYWITLDGGRGYHPGAQGKPRLCPQTTITI